MICFECICENCANNEERLNKKPGESDFFCYNCDTCRKYTGDWRNHKNNQKRECDKYKKVKRERVKREKKPILEILIGGKND